MEDVIQILVFIIIITSVIISKYKEVNSNRPGRHAQQPVEKNHETYLNDEKFNLSTDFDDEIENDEEDDLFKKLDELEKDTASRYQNFKPIFDAEEFYEETDEGFGGEFSKRNQKSSHKEEPAPFIPSSPEEALVDAASQGLDHRKSKESSKFESQKENTYTGENIPFIQPNECSPHSSSVTTQSSVTKKRTKVHLKTRREARQAFIYSEIFNRKYE